MPEMPQLDGVFVQSISLQTTPLSKYSHRRLLMRRKEKDLRLQSQLSRLIECQARGTQRSPATLTAK